MTVGLLLAGAIAALACGRENETALARARLSAGCAINSDCQGGLVCAFGRCHVSCVADRDCPGGRCLSSASGGACQLDDERACARNSDCPGTQLCGGDDTCRDACAADRDCRAGDVCAGGICATPGELGSGALAGKAAGDCRHASDCPGALVCLRGRCDVECVGSKDCIPSWTCAADTRCHPPGSTELLAQCVAQDGVGGAAVTATVLASASGGGPGTLFDDFPPKNTFQCVVRADRHVYCRGANTYATLGNGSTTTIAGWVPIALDAPTVALSLGGEQGCALGPAGEAYCWGLGVAAGTGGGGEYVSPGRVRLSASDVLPPVVRLRTALAETCALAADGTVYCWGADNFTGSGVSLFAGVASAATALGAVDDVGFYQRGTCFLRRAGDVYCAGDRVYGVIADGNGGTTQATPSLILGIDASHLPVRALAVGFGHACALGRDGVVLCWGGFIPEESGTTGGTALVPRVMQGLDAIASIASSNRSDFTCALRVSGEVLCWGNNKHGQLGVPSSSIAKSADPILVPGVTGATDISVASDQACARLADGRTQCWGEDAGVHVEAVPCP